jgi:hypothetical protein
MDMAFALAWVGLRLVWPVAGVLSSQPDLFFLSSALALSGFGDQLPSPNLPVTIFAPTNTAILNLLSELSAPRTLLRLALLPLGLFHIVMTQPFKWGSVIQHLLQAVKHARIWMGVSNAAGHDLIVSALAQFLLYRPQLSSVRVVLLCADLGLLRSPSPPQQAARESVVFFLRGLNGYTLLHPGSLTDLTIIILTQIALLCADLGLLDLLAFQSKLPGMLLYAVTLGGYSGDTLLQRGTIDTLLTQAENTKYALNFTLDSQDSHRVSNILL